MKQLKKYFKRLNSFSKEIVNTLTCLIFKTCKTLLILFTDKKPRQNLVMDIQIVTIIKILTENLIKTSILNIFRYLKLKITHDKSVNEI